MERPGVDLPGLGPWLTESRRRATADLMALIRIDSATPREAELLPVVEPWLRELGMVPRRQEFHPDLARHPAASAHPDSCAGEGGVNLRTTYLGTSGPHTLFSAHLDVVPAQRGYSTAFQPEWRDGAVYGRGACDTKGNLVMLLQALRFIRHQNLPLRRRVALDLVAEEEIGGNGALSSVLHGLEADEVVVLEPSGLKVFRGHRGCLTFTLEVEGEAVHMGADRPGVSAISAALRVVEELKAMERDMLDEAAGVPAFALWRRPVQINVGRIAGGEWPGSVAASCTIEGNFGFLPPVTVAEAMERLRRRLLEMDDPWCSQRHTLEFTGLRTAGYLTPAEAPVVQDLLAATGGERQAWGWNVSCDARLYAEQGGLPTAIFGAGDLVEAHSQHEHLPWQQFERGVEILVRFLVGEPTGHSAAR